MTNYEIYLEAWRHAAESGKEGTEFMLSMISKAVELARADPCPVYQNTTKAEKINN